MAIDLHEGVRAASDLNKMVPPSGVMRVLQHSHFKFYCHIHDIIVYSKCFCSK